MSQYRNSWSMARIGNQDGGRRERSNSGASAMQSLVVWSSDLVCLVFCVIPPAGVELGGVEEGWRASQGHRQNRGIAPEERLQTVE